MPTLEISTTRFGPVTIEESKIIHFVAPVLGFDEVQQYTLLDHADNSPFKWLQAIGKPDLAFVVTNPKFFSIPYEFALPEDAVVRLGIKSAQEVLVFTIVNIPAENPGFMTANLMAPIVINETNLQAMQLILQDPGLSTKVRLLPDADEKQQIETAASSHDSGKG